MDGTRLFSLNVMRRDEYIVWAVSLVLVLWGVYQFVAQVEGTWLFLRHGLFSSDSDVKLRFWLVLFLVFSVVVPLLTVFAGWGVFKFRHWGHMLALVICTLMFIVNFVGSINFAVQSYKAIDAPTPVIPKGSVAVYQSMWPTYITAIVSGVLVVILRWRPIRNLFAGKSYT